MPLPDSLQQLIERQPWMPVLNKIFMTQEQDPRVQQALAKIGVSDEPIAEQARRTVVTPIGRGEKAMADLLAGGAEAMTTSQGTGYDPQYLKGKTQDEIESLMAHELTHRRQFERPGNVGQSMAYNISHSPLLRLGTTEDVTTANPNEIEAYQYQLDRAHAGKHYRIAPSLVPFVGPSAAYR